MTRGLLYSVGIGVWSAVACTPATKPDAAIQGDDRKATPEPTKADVPATPPVAAKAEVPAPVTPVAAPPGADPAKAEPPMFPLPAPVEAASVEHLAPAWELVQEFEREVELAPLAGGVLARIGRVPHEVGPDGALLAKDAIDPSKPLALGMSHIEGVWPDDAWRITRTRRDDGSFDHAYYKWRANNRWVAQQPAGGLAADGSQSLRWTPRGGLLIFGDDDETVSFGRLAGKHGAPAGVPIVEDDDVRDVFESAGGTVFLFVASGVLETFGSLQILRSCKQGEAPGCERSGGAALPGSVRDKDLVSYTPGVMAGRGPRSMSAALRRGRSVIGGDGTRTSEHYLVHYETGGWKFEAVPGNVAVIQMLATADDGLWLVLGEDAQSLWHRSAAGTWVAVDLPARLAGASELQIALRDPTHMWVAGNTDDYHAIYAAPAALQASVVAVPASPSAGG